MVVELELLTNLEGSRTGRAWGTPCSWGAIHAGLSVFVSPAYTGRRKWLTLFGVGAQKNKAARDEHRSKALPVACWDIGYLGKQRELDKTYLRVSLNEDHPTHSAMDATAPDPSRWNRFGIRLREDSRKDGHILVVGLGQKSREYLNEFDWESRTLRNAAARFPGRTIVYRPKPRGSKREKDSVEWEERAEDARIEDVLRGASLVICRHSNVAVDACIAGIPVECTGGAANWLYNRSSAPTVPQRLDFLYRLCWWNWQLSEMEVAWKYLLKACA